MCVCVGSSARKFGVRVQVHGRQTDASATATAGTSCGAFRSGRRHGWWRRVCVFERAHDWGGVGAVAAASAVRQIGWVCSHSIFTGHCETKPHTTRGMCDCCGTRADARARARASTERVCCVCVCSRACACVLFYGSASSPSSSRFLRWSRAASRAHGPSVGIFLRAVLRAQIGRDFRLATAAEDNEREAHQICPRFASRLAGAEESVYTIIGTRCGGTDVICA